MMLLGLGDKFLGKKVAAILSEKQFGFCVRLEDGHTVTAIYVEMNLDKIERVAHE